MSEYQIVQAKDLEVGDDLLQIENEDLRVWSITHGVYIYVWVSKTQAIPFFPDEFVRRRINPQKLQSL